MSVRNNHSRPSELDIKFSFNGKLIILEREDTFVQGKSILYSIKRKILDGKLKLDIPQNDDIIHRFIVGIDTDRTLKYVKY